MRPLYYDFQIDGNPIPIPDSGIQIVPSDEIADDSGKDESKVTHRIVERTVDSFVIPYENLDTEDYLYWKSLVLGKDYFVVTHRLYGPSVQKIDAYCGKLPAFLTNAKNGRMKNLKITISQC